MATDDLEMQDAQPVASASTETTPMTNKKRRMSQKMKAPMPFDVDADTEYYQPLMPSIALAHVRSNQG